MLAKSRTPLPTFWWPVRNFELKSVPCEGYFEATLCWPHPELRSIEAILCWPNPELRSPLSSGQFENFELKSVPCEAIIAPLRPFYAGQLQSSDCSLSGDQ